MLANDYSDSNAIGLPSLHQSTGRPCWSKRQQELRYENELGWQEGPLLLQV